MLISKWMKREGKTHHFAHKIRRKEYVERELEPYELTKTWRNQGDENAEWREEEEGLQSKMWSLNLLGHDHLISSSSFGVVFLQRRMCLMEFS